MDNKKSKKTYPKTTIALILFSVFAWCSILTGDDSPKIDDAEVINDNFPDETTMLNRLSTNSFFDFGPVTIDEYSRSSVDVSVSITPGTRNGYQVWSCDTMVTVGQLGIMRVVKLLMLNGYNPKNNLTFVHLHMSQPIPQKSVTGGNLVKWCGNYNYNPYEDKIEFSPNPYMK